MSDNNNEHRQYLPHDDIDRDRIVIDVPPAPSVPYPDPVPNGYDAMGRIYLQGRSNRRLASGRIPWWVLITGWFTTGVGIFVVALPLLSTAGIFPMFGLQVIIFVIFALLPLSILWRDTIAKVNARK